VRKAPAGWEPGYSYDEKSRAGTITTEPRETEPDSGVWAELIADWGLDPARHKVSSVQVRGWDANVGAGEIKRLRYYRATIEDVSAHHADVEELVRLAGRKAPRAKGFVGTTHPAFVVSLNDWQIGKGEGGGTPATLAYLAEAWCRVLGRLRELNKLGRRPSKVILANTGDLIEATFGHYSSQAFTTDLNMREQLRVARRFIWGVVDDLVSL